MKKLAALVMILPLATFLAVAMTSAEDRGWQVNQWDYDQHWGGIHGTYEMTGVGTCINAPHGGFTENYTPQVLTPGDPDATPPIFPTYQLSFSGSNLFTGTWTFERNGHGKVKGFLFGTATPPYPTPNATKISFEFEFTYTLTRDGTIKARMDEDTYQATGVTGPLKGFSFTVRGITYSGESQTLSFFGKVSPDQSTLTINSANEIQEIADVNGNPINYQICNVGRVLIRVGD